MKVAILETGHPPGNLAERFGDYPTMFGKLLGDGFDLQTFDVAAGELPESAQAFDAYLITVALLQADIGINNRTITGLYNREARNHAP